MASTYLQKVPSSAGSTTTGTFSFWVKIAGTGTQAIYTVSDGSSQFDIYIRNSSGQLDFYAYNGSSYINPPIPLDKIISLKPVIESSEWNKTSFL